MFSKLDTDDLRPRYVVLAWGVHAWPGGQAGRQQVDPTVLAESEALFRLAMERSAVGMCIVAPAGTFLNVNSALCDMLGRTEEELLSSTWQALTHPDDLHTDLELAGAVAAGERDEYRLLKRYLRPDSTVIWGDLSVGVVRHVDGAVAFYVSQIIDVTELVLAREALAESELQYRMLAEHASDVVLRIDEHRRILWASPSAAEVFGWEPSELFGRQVEELVHPDDAARVRDGLDGPVPRPSALDEFRVRRADGRHAWASGRRRHLASGEGGGSVVSLRDITERVTARRAREQLDARYRLLAENTTDVVCETGTDGTLRWVSPSAEHELGWKPDEIVGRDAIELIAPGDRARAAEELRLLFADIQTPDAELRVQRADGDAQWMSLHGELLRDGRGEVVGAVIGLRDCQAEVVLRRALQTHAAGHAVLARATSEDQLLTEMCQVTVDDAGYLFAWYARRCTDASQSVECVARSHEHADYVDGLRFSWGDDDRDAPPTSVTLRTGCTTIEHDIAAGAPAPWRTAAIARGFRSAISVPVFVNGVLDGAFTLHSPELDAFDTHTVGVLEDLAGQLGFGIQRLRDAEALATSVRQSHLLRSVVEQAAEAIVITDPSASIVYANPAAERSSGYTFEEMHGHNPRIFQSGLHPSSYFEALWSSLVGGETWRGILVNRRKNGEVYEELSTIAPVYDIDGSLTAYVAIKRDITRERSLEAELTQTRSDQRALAEVMDAIRVGESLEDTASDFCNAATRLPGVDGAAVLLIRPDDVLVTVASTAPPPFVTGKAFVGNASDATWHHRLRRGRTAFIDLEDPELGRTSALVAAARANGIRGAAVLPIHWDEELAGVAVLLSFREDGHGALRDLTTVIAEMGAFATSLLGHQLMVRRGRETLLQRLRSIIDTRAFWCAYQPVVDLLSGGVCGYEALTRFDDGSDPVETFAAAHSVGLGVELELACLTAAIDEAPLLPSDAWLSLNLSPSVLLEPRARPVLLAAGRQIVIEITEHSAVHDYPQLRRALGRFPGVWLSVDDAGAGYSSLRHILELDPHIVKLDAALVRDIDTDPARQGLAAGLRHFAEQMGRMLVAEGVETPQQARTLLRLGIRYAQGYLYGAPTATR